MCRDFLFLSPDVRVLFFMPQKLQVIISSTRPGRVGPSVGAWFADCARRHGGFEIEPVDLADFQLPVYDEPVHPRMQQYEHEHTRRWSRSVASADAYVFVMPEYNYMPPPSLVNALDYVSREWGYKPCGFVGYGGVSGGLRAVQIARLHVTTLRMMPMVETVAIPMVASLLSDDGVFGSNELIDASAKSLLDELQRWSAALAPMRAK